MNSDIIFDIIEEVASTTKKNIKLDILKTKAANNELAAKLFKFAYDPLIRFGVRDVQPSNTSGVATIDDKSLSLLTELYDSSLTGNAARDALKAEFDRLTPKSANLLYRVIQKDLRAGFSDSTLNKVYKNLIPEFPYQRCSLPKHVNLKKDFPWLSGVFSQLKADGSYANGSNYIDRFQLQTRPGQLYPMDSFTEISDFMETKFPKGHQTHGEMVIEYNGLVLPRQIGNGLLNSLQKGGQLPENHRIIYEIWDAVPLDAIKPKGKYKDQLYKERLEELQSFFKDYPNGPVRLIETKVVFSLREALEHAQEFMKKGLEGSVIKHPDMIWEDGTSKRQVKIKLDFTVDLEIVEILEGNKNTKNEGRPGSLLCMSSDKKVAVAVTVKNEKMRETIESNPSDWIGKIAAVTANNITEPNDENVYSLFLPRFAEDEYRNDKSIADDYDKILAEYDSTIDKLIDLYCS